MGLFWSVLRTPWRWLESSGPRGRRLLCSCVSACALLTVFCNTAQNVGMIASAVWLFPTMVSAFGSEDASTVLEASILTPMFAHALFEPVSFGIGLYAWMFFALTWFMEQNDRSRIDWVTTDAARSALMRRAIASARVRGEQDSITKSGLRDAVGSRFRPIFALARWAFVT